MKVQNIHGKHGAVKNQFVIMCEDGVYFQSYDTCIAFRPRSGKIKLDREAWDYSVTTGKYRNIFLGETKRETQRKIDSGEYELVDLNANDTFSVLGCGR